MAVRRLMETDVEAVVAHPERVTQDEGALRYDARIGERPLRVVVSRRNEIVISVMVLREWEP